MREHADGIWIIDTSGHTLYANERMAQILGASRSELMGCLSFDFVFPEDRAAAETLFDRKRTGDSNPFTFRLRKKDGSSILVSVQGTPMKDAKGGFIGIVGTFTAIESVRFKASGVDN
jgi:PAS domain S-box-containing protein